MECAEAFHYIVPTISTRAGDYVKERVVPLIEELAESETPVSSRSILK